MNRSKEIIKLASNILEDKRVFQEFVYVLYLLKDKSKAITAEILKEKG